MAENTVGSDHWSDEPLARDAIDTLGREPFVATIVARIRQASSSDPSTVFGLVGEWGSGKTSILRRVRTQIGDDWLIAEYTPWSSYDSGAMTIEFVSTLANALNLKKTRDQKQFIKYATIISPLLGLLPVGGGVARGLAEKIIGLFTERPPWHVQFEKLSNIIQSSEKKVLILVDDVDRLDADELLALLRIVRLLGRFRGVHYLLAYDQQSLEDLLQSKGSAGRSRKFMEKIVQYPFEMPPIPRSSVKGMLKEMFSEFMISDKEQISQLQAHRASELINILIPQIRTPRTLIRFREHLAAFFGDATLAELDNIDYIAVTWLKLESHDVWMKLPDWHAELRTGVRTVSLNNEERLSENDWLRRVADVSALRNARNILAVLAFLFPEITLEGRSKYIYHERSFANPDYAIRYLTVSIPEGDVSDKLVRETIVELTSDGGLHNSSKKLAGIIDGKEEDRSELAVRKFERERHGTAGSTLQLISYLEERRKARASEIGTVGAPIHELRSLLAREICCSLVNADATSEQIINIVGDVEALKLVSLGLRSPTFREHKETILKGFGEYWSTELRSRHAALARQGSLGLVADLLSDTCPPETLRGLLDSSISDYEDLIEIGMCFTELQEWVGSATSTYELAFKKKAFAIMVSSEALRPYGLHLETEARSKNSQTAELGSPDVSKSDIRTFTVNSILDIISGGS